MIKHLVDAGGRMARDRPDEPTGAASCRCVIGARELDKPVKNTKLLFMQRQPTLFRIKLIRES